jgi:hypothetical protein
VPTRDSTAKITGLEAALSCTFVAHGYGMLTMAACLLPGIPGGSGHDTAARITFIATHHWLWRIGWSGWQITALSDLLLGIALLVTPWIPKLPAIFTVIFTVLAIIPDQTGQALWTWQGVKLAQDASASGDFAAYLAFEHRTFQWIAGYGTVGYLLAALGWTWCFAAAGAWSRRLTQMSIATWGIFAAATCVLFLPRSWQTPMLATLVSIGNAIAFVLLMIWLVAVDEQVARRCRPTAAHGWILGTGLAAARRAGRPWRRHR